MSQVLSLPEALYVPMLSRLHLHGSLCRSVFSAMPELTALLPPEAPSQARPFSLGALQGQQARATVYIEEILLPQVQDGLQPRPKSAVYHTIYRLALASG